MAQPGDSMVPRRGPLVPGTVIDGRYRIVGLIGTWHALGQKAAPMLREV